MTLPDAAPAPAVSLDLTRVPVAATAFGVALLSATVALSATYSRHTGELDGSNFTTGVLAAVGLLGLAVAARLMLPDSAERTTLMSWPGTAGAASAGLMVGVLISDEDASVYLGAAIGIALAAVGYLVIRTVPFLLAAIAGIAVLYAKIFSDVIDTGGDGKNTFMIVGAAIAVFTVALTSAGWLLPETRILIGVVVGAGSIGAMCVLLQVLMFARAFGAYDSGSGFTLSSAMRDNPYENDIYVVLGLCVLLALFWSACSVITGHVGFRVLVVSILVLSIPMTTMALTTAHPTWWAVGAGAIGGFVLLAVAFRAISDASRPAQ